MQEKIFLAGMVLILMGILLIILGNLIGITKGNNSVNTAVGGFIGPIPFGFFTNKKMFWIFWIFLLITFAFWFLLRRII